MPQKQSLFDRPLFISGLPRSGTSLVAGLCKKAGFWCGSTVPGDQHNPRGYFEHIGIREQVVKRTLAAHGCDPLGVRKLPKPGELDMSLPIRREVGELLKKDGYRAQRPWFYKDAKLTLLWPLFHKAFPDAAWLIVSRDTPSFIDSCLRTRFMQQHSTERGFWENMAREYTNRLDALREQGKKVYEVEAPRLFSGDFSELQAVFSHFDIEVQQKKLEKFVSEEFWHGKRQD